jgi:hypothetical protein
MGQDNGKDQLVNVSDNLIAIREYVRSVSRTPTREETQRMLQIAASPWNT